MKPNNIEDLFICERILPPFLGELGYEVRHFVALVEPWLRSGWKLISKRPELYPTGTTLYPRDLFDQINILKIKHNGQEVHSGICVDFARRDSIPELDYAVARRNFELDLRSLLRPYLDKPGRPLTLFDKSLTSASYGLNDFFLSSYHGLKPSYKPESFVRGNPTCPSHIGVQFRRMAAKDEHRNSDWQRYFPIIKQLANEIGLELLVYGEQLGCEFPPDCARASSYHALGSTGLGGDLACLQNCKLMFSPDSGWTDLMAWLQVPSIVMKLHTDYTYLSLIPFDPVIEIYDEKIPLLEQFNQCLSRKKCHIELVGADNGSSHLIPYLFELSTVWQS
jgi:hypothetical protein